MPALGRLLAAGRELSALLEALEDIVVLGGAELLRVQAGALSAALAATLRGVHEAICAPQPVTAASAAGMPKRPCASMQQLALQCVVVGKLLGQATSGVEQVPLFPRML